MGRHTIFNQELADKICEYISTSNKSLRTICKELNISVASVLNWLNDKENTDFLAQYARAKEEQADFLAEEIIELADTELKTEVEFSGNEGSSITTQDNVQRSRLMIESRKWLAMKLKPKKYGDKLDLTSGGDKLTPVIIDWNGSNTNTKTEGSASNTQG